MNYEIKFQFRKALKLTCEHRGVSQACCNNAANALPIAT